MRPDPTDRLGCIADDFTGATDLANNLVRGGLRVLQTFGVPDRLPDGVDADAIIVALKSRTAPVADAVADAVAASDWLVRAGARRQYFKVCSTFDSTPRGNIGPVLEALMRRRDAPFCVVTPAFPTLSRTVYLGHLFVGTQLLSDSPMRHHPLTPMTDSNLVRLLQQQLEEARVALIELPVVRQGAAAVRARIGELQRDGFGIAIADAVEDADLLALGQACVEAALVCAGSGLAIGLAAARGERHADANRLPPGRGAAAIVSGSCSSATQAQVAHFLQAGGAGFHVDPLRLAGGAPAMEAVVHEALQWAGGHPADCPVLVYATAAPESVRAVQRALGAEQAGQVVEEALSRIACGLVRAGVGRLVVAGGETSGACMQALGVKQVLVGPQIDPGVPWCHAGEHAAGPGGLHLALKSGNFGRPDFFSRCFEVLAP